jgi:hypothetical protein
VSQTTPQASFTFDFNGATSVTITHDGGTTLNSDNTDTLQVTSDSASSPASWDGGLPVSAGSSTTFTDYSSNDEVRVIWTSANGDTSATLGRQTAP